MSPRDDGVDDERVRPASIGELAEYATRFEWDASRDLKHCLRMAESSRNRARAYQTAGDLESAFVFFARAATIALEKLPAHPQYSSALTSSQRDNLGLNGQEILDCMGKIKPVLVDRFNEWRAAHPKDPLLPLSDHQVLQQRPRPQHQPPLDRPKLTQAAADDIFSQPPAHRHGSQSTKVVVIPPDASQRRKQAEHQGIVRRQQQAEAEARQIRQAMTVNNAGLQQQGSLSSVATNGPSSYYQVPPQGSMPAIYPLHLQSVAPPPVVMPSPSNPVTPVHTRHTTPSPAPTPINQQPAHHHTRSESPALPFLFPGSSPANLHRTPTRATIRSQGSQGFFSTTSPPPKDARALFPSLMSPHQQQQGYYPSYFSMSMSMDRLNLNDTANTSPSASSFHPSFGIRPPSANPPPAWAFGTQESAKRAAAAAVAAAQQNGGPKLERTGMEYVPTSSGSVPYIPMPPPPPNSTSSSQVLSTDRRISPPPPPPPPPFPSYPQSHSRHHSHPHQRQDQYQHRDRPHPGSSLKEKKLKAVVLPREVLPRFLAIASLNTNTNVETCGLLLGNEVWVDDGGDEHGQVSYHGNGKHHEKESTGGRKKTRCDYVVTTLLIPKQRGTSDTCTMDGEELVLEFVDQRSLITLGWIHTHPSQSCFMSSVDLHTHSGFQKMLPESVAVVCAPKSHPNFGIFRLTDPPGLSTILGCEEKEAFHPHPDLPIYTDADKGHVQMRDSALEIIDMR